MTTKRGINLGCGNIILPCEQPGHHQIIPAELYTDPGIAWDNVDWNAGDGVNHVENLFAYPWALETDAYDCAICSHIAEHIPHGIVWNGRDWGPYRLDRLSPPVQAMVKQYGQLIPNHPDYQDGWFAWFAELWRIMKPGGVAYISVPYAWSLGAISDPTHTRYLTPATFNYFKTGDEFDYRAGGARWDVRILGYSPHGEMVDRIAREMERSDINLPPHILRDAINMMAVERGQSEINGVADMAFAMRAIKDGAQS